jgi:hypothetical protein
MSHDIWLAAAISIPVSLVTGLLVRPIHNWLDAKGKTRAQRKIARRKLEYWSVLYFLGNPREFQDWLLNAALRALIGIVFVMLGGFLGAALLVSLTQSHLLHPNAPLSISDKTASILGMILCVSTSFMGGFYFSVLLEGVKTYKVVRLPLQFFDKVPEDIRNRDSERQALERRSPWNPF